MDGFTCISLLLGIHLTYTKVFRIPRSFVTMSHGAHSPFPSTCSPPYLCDIRGRRRLKHRCTILASWMGPVRSASNRQRVVVALPHLFQHSDAFLESQNLFHSQIVLGFSFFKKPGGGAGGTAPKSCGGGGDLAAVVAAAGASLNANCKWSLLLILYRGQIARRRRAGYY